MKLTTESIVTEWHYDVHEMTTATTGYAHSLGNLFAKIWIALLAATGVALAQDNAPTSIAGKSAVVVISSGTGPFAPIGGYRIAFSQNSATYSISPLSSTVAPSAGTYTYTKTAANTARITVTDSLVGVGVVQNLVFSSLSTASYSISSGGSSSSGTVVFEGITTTTTVLTGDRLINLSVRAQVPVGGQTIPGFVLAAQSRVLIRVAGPALASFGVQGTLGNPRFSLFRDSNQIVTNDDWSSTTANQLAVTSSGSQAAAFPFVVGSRDAAAVVDLAPGAYTAVITGDSGTGGEVLLEVYRVP